MELGSQGSPRTQPAGAPRLDPYDRAQSRDPYPTYRWLRDRDPLHRNEEHGFWALSRHADVLAAFLDPATFSSARGSFLHDDPARVGRTLGTSDPPRHDRLRRLAGAGFSVRRVAELEPAVRAIAASLLAPARETRRLDVAREYATPLASAVIARILGLPEEDVARIQGWAERSVRVGAGEEHGSEAQREALAALLAYLGAAVELRRSRPDAFDDVLGDLAAAEIDGDRLADDELRWLAQALFVAGYDTTSGAIANAASVLADHPDARRRLREEPPLLPDAVEEILRWDSPAQGFQRTLTRAVSLPGGRLEAGDRVLLLPGSANRDEREFPDPDAFRIERRPRRHLALGQGIHYCLGASLARLETRVALHELLARAGDYGVEREGAERAHSSRFMLRGFSRLPIRFAIPPS